MFGQGGVTYAEVGGDAFKRTRKRFVKIEQGRSSIMRLVLYWRRGEIHQTRENLMDATGLSQRFQGPELSHTFGVGREAPTGPRFFQSAIPACWNFISCPSSSRKLTRCFISMQELPYHSEPIWTEMMPLLGGMCQSAVTYASTIVSQLVIELSLSKEAHQQAIVCTVISILSSQITFCHYL